ncbi:hypothetical protein HOLleu_19747 [Holothuria leucospilota]|uniref:Uncharacterized protein n=1 Tax=Holothuria leucospilota TaxID=206669 RepID=A0A9Q1H7W2_HOLLE|nr:hypothetical protein HOLleu_19747 [Holothuria leucospilota]
MSLTGSHTPRNTTSVLLEDPLFRAGELSPSTCPPLLTHSSNHFYPRSAVTSRILLSSCKNCLKLRLYRCQMIVC